ncbi:hypothetical protein F5882DRAFT_437757 [Hyaloscypha sp. PMI_1271]|nr:hypothetical protein F5882DRAFT_437757 [Hyaloscypha sp. PMI_1271]
MRHGAPITCGFAIEDELRSWPKLVPPESEDSAQIVAELETEKISIYFAEGQNHSTVWVNAHPPSFVGIAGAVSANAHPLSSAGIAGTVSANAHPLSFAGIARVVSANAHPLSFAGIARVVSANAHPLSFAGIVRVVSANAHPLSFVGIIEAANAHSLSFSGMLMVVLEEKINSTLFEGLIIVASANVPSVSFIAVIFIVSEGDINSSLVAVEQVTGRWDYINVFAGTEICVVLTTFCALIESLSISPYARFLV